MKVRWSHIAVIVLLLATSAFAANDVYIAQTQAGTGDGLSCANAKAYTYFNTSGNWSVTPTGIQIGPDTTVHICGTLDSRSNAATLLTFQGSGTSGHPVTLYFETGAIVQAAYCSPQGCINLGGRSYIVIDGGPSCGKLSGATGATTSCNGKIRTTAIGSTGQTCIDGPCTPVSSSVQVSGIGSSGSPANIEIRNLYIRLYVRTPRTRSEQGDRTSGGTQTYGIGLFGGTMAQGIIVHNMYFEDMHKAYLVSLGSSSGTVTGYELYNSYITNQCWAMGVGVDNANLNVAGLKFHDNEVSNWDYWTVANYAGSSCHTNGTMWFNGNGSITRTGSTGFIGDASSGMWNNYLHGSLTGEDAGTSPSGFLSCQDNCINIAMFNNLVVDDTSAGAPNGGGIAYFNGAGGGGQRVYNNTFVKPSGSFSVWTASTSNGTFKNNILRCTGTNCAAVEIRRNCPTCVVSDNNDGYQVGTWAINNSASSGQSISLATWRATYGQDVNSVTTNPNLDANNKLQAGSPAISLGTNLTSVGIAALDFDLAGIGRPGSGAWDAGAYQYATTTQYTVTAGKSGSGSGTIASSPAGIDCGSACYYSFNAGTSVTFSQSTSDVFTGWGGTCGCTGTGSCSVTVNASCTVTAAFDVATTSAPGVSISGGVTLSGGFSFGLGTSPVGPPNYGGGRTAKDAVAIAHVNVGPNACDWTSMSTLANCGNLTGANTTITPGTFGAQTITRVTDRNTACGGIAASASNVWIDADDGLPNLWNKTDTAFIIKRAGQQRCLMHWNATTKTATPSPYVVGSGDVTWDTQDPTAFYSLNGTTLQKTVMNLSADTGTTSTIVNFATANCLGAGFTSTWVGILLSPANGVFSVAFSNSGGQGAAGAVYAASYNSNTGQCSVFNTSTGDVTVNGSSIGAIGDSDRYLIHEVYQTQNPQWAIITVGSNGWTTGTSFSGYYEWEIGTTNLIACGRDGTYYCDGHAAWGVNGAVRAKTISYTPYADPSSQKVNLTGPLTYPDLHPSWNNNNGSDTAWVMNKAQKVATTDNLLATLPVAFYNEIWMNSVDGSGNVSRQFHTYATGDQGNFEANNAIAVISQTGRYILLISNWMNTLGSTSGAAACTPGTDCRNDAFVGEPK